MCTTLNPQRDCPPARTLHGHDSNGISIQAERLTAASGIDNAH